MITVLTVILVAGLGETVFGDDRQPTLTIDNIDATATMTALKLKQLELLVTLTARAMAQTPTQVPLTRTPRPTSTPASASQQPIAAVLVDGLNVRSGPGSSFSVVGKAVLGQQFPVTGQMNGCAWLRVVLDNGSIRWISGAPTFTALNVPCSRLPVVTRAETPTSRPTATRTAPPPIAEISTTSTPADSVYSPGGPTGVTKLVPPDGESSLNPTLFAWEANAALQPGQAFEVLFWRDDEMPGAWVGAGTEPSIIVRPSDKAGGKYNWQVWLVNINPSYQQVRPLSEIRTFTVPNTGGGSSENHGGNDSTPTPKPR